MIGSQVTRDSTVTTVGLTSSFGCEYYLMLVLLSKTAVGSLPRKMTVHHAWTTGIA
jgi:hypothetical protein